MLTRILLSKRELITNIAWRGLQVFSTQGILFMVFLFAANRLGVHDFGVYNYVLAVTFLLMLFSDFGISTATSRYVAEYNAVDQEKLHSVLFTVGWIIIGISSVIVLITLLVSSIYFDSYGIYAIYSLPLLVFSPLSSLLDGIYRGLKEFHRLALISIVSSCISVPLMIVAIMFGGIKGALLSQSIFYALLTFFRLLGYTHFRRKFNLQVAKEIGRYSLYFGFATLGYYLFSRVDIVILGKYGYVQQIGVYELLNKFVMIGLMPFGIIGQVMAPDFTLLSVHRRFSTIYSALSRYTIVFGLVGVIAAAIVYLILPVVLNIFLPEYVNQYLLELIPIIAIIFALNISSIAIDNGVVVPIGYATTMSGLYITLGVLNLVLSLVLLKIFGYIGVIYATAICTFLMVVLLRSIVMIKVRRLM